MVKSELIAVLHKKMPLISDKDVELAVDYLLQAITDALSNGERIEVRGFGVFSLNQRPPRQGRNPKTGELVQVPAKPAIHFKAGKELRERVNVKQDQRVTHS